MIYLIMAMILYAAGILIGASAARNANTNLVSAINNLFAVFIPLIIVIPALSKKTFTSQKYGVLMAVLGGIVISLFVLALNKSFTQNKVGVVAPVVFGGAILISTVLSYFIFKEKIDGIETVGLVLVLAGLGFLIYARAIVK